MKKEQKIGRRRRRERRCSEDAEQTEREGDQIRGKRVTENVCSHREGAGQGSWGERQGGAPMRDPLAGKGGGKAGAPDGGGAGHCHPGEDGWSREDPGL